MKILAILIIFFSLFYRNPARADLEIGLGLSEGGIYFKSESSNGKISPSAGFEAFIGYKRANWLPYLKLEGKFTRYTDANLTLFDSSVSGNIPVRVITYSLGSRYYPAKSWYVFLAPALSTSNLDIDDSGINISGGSLQRRFNPFIDGFGFQTGFGFHPMENSIYIQISYEFFALNKVVIEEETDDTSRTVDESNTNGTLLFHGLFITFGFTPVMDKDIP